MVKCKSINKNQQKIQRHFYLRLLIISWVMVANCEIVYFHEISRNCLGFITIYKNVIHFSDQFVLFNFLLDKNMSLNTANTPDGRGVIIYNGEIILLFVREVCLTFEKFTHPDFKGTKKGNLYLTSHRIIFNNTSPSKHDDFKSLSMPFGCIRNVKLEQPIFGANYLAGELIAQPDGNWSGEVQWKLTFNRGGCIDFGQCLLKTSDMANAFCPRPANAPPPYAPPCGAYYSPPPAYYWTGGQYHGYQAPTNAFPEQPPPESVFMYEQPPPYAGIGPVPQNPAPQQPAAHYPHMSGPSAPLPPPNYSSTSNTNNLAPYPASAPLPSYDQATSLPQKAKVE